MAVGTLNPVITTLGDEFGCNFISTGLLMEEKDDPTDRTYTGTNSLNLYRCAHRYKIHRI